MICPNCQNEQPEGSSECLRCGLILAKYRPRSKMDIAGPDETAVPAFYSIKDILFADPPQPSPALLVLKSLLLVFLAFISIRISLVPVDDPQSFSSFTLNIFHTVNLVFHEAGHVVFRLLGNFLSVLGGTLMQLAVPAVFAVYFLFWRRDTYASAVTFWWFGENFLDIAPYAYDAKDLNLVLLGGHTGKEGFHDWEYLLGSIGLIEYSHGIGRAIWLAGISLMMLSLAWAGFLVYRQHRIIKGRP